MEEEPRSGFRGKNCIQELYERLPEGGVVVCYDEFGPMELRPIHGTGWFAKQKRSRLRVTYRRLSGAEQLLSFYDVHADWLQGTVCKRKTSGDLLSALRRLRACYPQETRIYLIMGNLPSHKHRGVASFIEDNNMEVAWTPTYASWLNAKEAHFAFLKKLVLSNSDDMSHDERRKRTGRYLTWRNREHSARGCPLAGFRRIKLEVH
ncbi:MAG: transposase [Actinomycetota bacterium]|nr:transposase [Actinomycetota bacterium]